MPDDGGDMKSLAATLATTLYINLLILWFALGVPMLLKMDTQVAHWIAYGFSAFWVLVSLYAYWLITFKASRPA